MRKNVKQVLMLNRKAVCEIFSAIHVLIKVISWDIAIKSQNMEAAKNRENM